MTFRSAQTLLAAAVVVVAVCMMVPYGMWLIYPFDLVGTFIHEAGHALAAVGTGGSVEQFVIRLDTSGYVSYRGGVRLIATPAGYLASVAVGAALLVAGTQATRVRAALWSTAGGLLIVTALFSGYGASLLAFGAFVSGLLMCSFARASGSEVQAALHSTAGSSPRRPKRSWPRRIALPAGLALMGGALAYMFITGGLLAWAVGGLMALVLWSVAAYAPPRWQQGTVIFLGVQLALDGLNSILTLWTLTRSDHAHNDAATMAGLTGLPAEFWAGAWGLLSLLVIAGALRHYGRPTQTPVDSA
jgi:hypothetical protein